MTATASAATTQRWRIDQASTPRVDRVDVSRRSPARELACAMLRARATLLVPRSSRALIIGVSVNETSRLTITATAAVMPNW